MKNKKCPHCYPLEENHWHDKMVSYLETLIIDPLAERFTNFFPKRIIESIDILFIRFLVFILRLFDLVEVTSQIDRRQFYNRTLVIWDEAKKLQLDIRAYQLKNKNKSYLSFFSWHNQGKTRYFQELPLFDIVTQSKNLDTKEYFRKVLEKNNWPIAPGQSFFSIKKAKTFGRKIGFPLVVKPNDSSLSRHAFFQIKSWEDFDQALRIAKQISAKVIVERFAIGHVYRAVVIDGQMVACAKRMPATIYGDGENTIKSLIANYNKHPWRLPKQRRDATLHQIEVNDDLEIYLNSLGLRLDDVLSMGQKIVLGQKITLGAGAEIVNVTESLHPETKNLCEKVSQSLSAVVCGLDFICEDEKKHYQDQSFIFLENNTLPYIDMHHFPTQGAPINVAEKIWQYALKNG